MIKPNQKEELDGIAKMIKGGDAKKKRTIGNIWKSQLN